MDQRTVSSPSDLPLPKRLKCFLGVALVKTFPHLAKAVAENPFNPEWGPFHRALRNGLYYQALTAGDATAMRKFLRDYWASQEGRAFHEDFLSRFEDNFLSQHVVLIDALESLLASNPGLGRHLCEIGTGSGQVISYMANRFKQFQLLTGIDLSPDQIEANTDQNSDPRIHYVCADALEWIPDNAQSHTVFLTNGGVLEYLTQADLSRLFLHIAERLKPAIVAIIETKATNHDWSAQEDSLIYGNEFSFSHNYDHLLTKAGFEITFSETQPGEHAPWVLLMAVAR